MSLQCCPRLHFQMHLQVHHQMQRQMRPFCHLLVHLQWLFKMLNHFVHSYALTTAGTSVPLMQPEVSFLVQHQMYLLAHLYIHKYRSSPLGATPGVVSGPPWIEPSSASQMHLSFLRLNSHSYFQFLIGQILHPSAPLSPFLRAFWRAFYIRSHLQCQRHLLESYLWLCDVVPSRLLTALSKMFPPTHVSFTVLELHYILAWSKGQPHFEIMQVSYVLR